MSEFHNPSPVDSDAEFEAQLRGAAPTVPPALRSRTLMRCAAEREMQRRNRRRGQWRWAWTLAGIGAFHWGTSCYLDAQNAALIRGKQPTALVAKVPLSTDKLRLVFQVRSRLLAALTGDRIEASPLRRDAG